MFKKVEIPIIGIVENMSYFRCPNCGERHDIFGHGGARATAEKLDVPFLGEVPLHMDIRTLSDEGRPIVATEPASEHAGTYRQVAANVASQMAAINRTPPRIVIE